MSQPLSHIIPIFHLDGVKYDIEQFQFELNQPVDFKGQPQHEAQGGQIHIVLTQCPDDVLYEWVGKSTMQKNGKVVFITEQTGTVLSIQFKNAYCVKLSLEVDAYAGTKTALHISPEIVIMNDAEHTNRWSK